MVEEKQESSVVDFQEAFEKKVAEAGKSKELKEIKLRAEKRDEADNPLNFLGREEVQETLGLTSNDIFEMIETFEKNNPSITNNLREEIEHYKKTCKDHYEKGEKEKLKSRKLEAENDRLKSLVHGVTTSIGDNVTYYVLILMFITMLVLLFVGAVK